MHCMAKAIGGYSDIVITIVVIFNNNELVRLIIGLEQSYTRKIVIELCPSKMKPEETLVEVRSDSNVQIDR